MESPTCPKDTNCRGTPQTPRANSPPATRGSRSSPTRPRRGDACSNVIAPSVPVRGVVESSNPRASQTKRPRIAPRPFRACGPRLPHVERCRSASERTGFRIHRLDDVAGVVDAVEDVPAGKSVLRRSRANRHCCPCYEYVWMPLLVHEPQSFRGTRETHATDGARTPRPTSKSCGTHGNLAARLACQKNSYGARPRSGRRRLKNGAARVQNRLSSEPPVLLDGPKALTNFGHSTSTSFTVDDSASSVTRLGELRAGTGSHDGSVIYPCRIRTWWRRAPSRHRLVYPAYGHRLFHRVSPKRSPARPVRPAHAA